MPTTSELSGRKLNFPAWAGMALAVNAVPDTALFVEDAAAGGGDASVVLRHDWNSTCARPGSRRLLFSRPGPAGAPDGRDVRLLEGLRSLESGSAAQLLLLSLQGPTDGLASLLAGRLRAPVAVLPGGSGDWLDGWSEALDALARSLELKRGAGHPEKIAIIGYFNDRGEGDHRGNLEELRRLTRELTLKLVSVWLGGGGLDTLRSVEEAGVLVALPHGRKAAATIAARTGARVIEAELPFGLGATERWIRTVGEACGRPGESDTLVDAELGHAVPRLQRFLPRLFLNRRVLFSGDPFYMPGFAELCGELGLRLTGAVATAAPGPGRPSPSTYQVLWEPEAGSAPLGELLRQPVDAAVCSDGGVSAALEAEGVPVIPFGFPSEGAHFIADRPFLGARGALCFADRLAEALARGRKG